MNLRKIADTFRRRVTAPRKTAAKKAPPPPVEHRGFAIPRRLAWRTGLLKNFTDVSDRHIETLRQFAALDEARDIVEIGCGVGRDAITLIDVLPDGGSYFGIDVMGDSIAWAQQNVTARDPRFEFAHFDVRDPQHNPGGAHDMASYRIGRPDGSVDLVFLFSVFTHMFPADVAQYLRDFERILRPGGRVFASVFVMRDGFSEHLVRIGGGGARQLTFQHEVEPGFFHNDPEKIPGATAYTLDRLTREAEAAGLSLTKFVRGDWARTSDAEHPGQDFVILEKP